MRWKTAGRIALGWLITIPAAGAVGALAALIANLAWWGVILDVVLAVGAIVAIFLVSRRRRVDATHFHQPQPAAFVRPKRKKASTR